MIRDVAAEAIETLKTLPASQNESFASGFETVTLELGETAGEMVKRREVMPTKLLYQYLNQTSCSRQNDAKGILDERLQKRWRRIDVVLWYQVLMMLKQPELRNEPGVKSYKRNM